MLAEWPLCIGLCSHRRQQRKAGLLTRTSRRVALCAPRSMRFACIACACYLSIAWQYADVAEQP